MQKEIPLNVVQILRVSAGENFYSILFVTFIFIHRLIDLVLQNFMQHPKQNILVLRGSL